MMAEACLRAAERHGLEGIVSKRRDSPYRSGAMPRLVQGEDGGLASCEPGAVAAVSARLSRAATIARLADIKRRHKPGLKTRDDGDGRNPAVLDWRYERKPR